MKKIAHLYRLCSIAAIFLLTKNSCYRQLSGEHLNSAIPPKSLPCLSNDFYSSVVILIIMTSGRVIYMIIEEFF
jgi:hypothetical protein